jgi:hypothetical protein
MVAGHICPNKEIFTALEVAYQIEFYVEDLDAAFPDEASQRELREWYFKEVSKS